MAVRPFSQRLGVPLSELAIFEECSPAQLASIDRLGTSISAPEGRVLAREGERGCEFIVLVTGSARCAIGHQAVGTLAPGDFLGELGLVHRAARSTTVTVTAPAELLVFERREFAGLLAAAPSVGRRITYGPDRSRYRVVRPGEPAERAHGSPVA